MYKAPSQFGDAEEWAFRWTAKQIVRKIVDNSQDILDCEILKREKVQEQKPRTHGPSDYGDGRGDCRGKGAWGNCRVTVNILHTHNRPTSQPLPNLTIYKGLTHA